MAAFAGALPEAIAELPLMKIAMAIETIFESHCPRRRTGFVAAFAGQGAVAAFQWKPGQIMIESRAAANIFPAAGLMAGGAILSQATLMGIVMAGGALRESDSAKFDKTAIITEHIVYGSGVALQAVELQMPAVQFKTRLAIMVKFSGRLPAFHRVAVEAIFGLKLPAVLITMATQAIAIQPQESFLQIAFFFLKAVFIRDMLRLMATAAVDCPMGAE